MKYTPRLKQKYQNEVVNSLKKNYKSVMQVPKLIKICLNQGLGSALSDKKQIEAAQNEMTIITGQKAVLTRSTKDISNFKLRKGMPIGVMVTLRGDKMYEFLDRLITSTLPRVRDFSGLPLRGFDRSGNYTLGIKEQIAFQEISIDKINKITGMDVTFVTNTDSDSDALLLFKALGFPFRGNDDSQKEKETQLEKQRKEKRREAEDQAKLDASLEEGAEGKQENSETDIEQINVEENNQDLSGEVDKSESLE